MKKVQCGQNLPTLLLTEKIIKLIINLDVIISVGYRVKSLRGTQFRIWASNVLTEYMKKGFAMNDDLLKNNGGGIYFDVLNELKDHGYIECVAT